MIETVSATPATSDRYTMIDIVKKENEMFSSRINIILFLSCFILFFHIVPVMADGDPGSDKYFLGTMIQKLDTQGDTAWDIHEYTDLTREMQTLTIGVDDSQRLTVINDDLRITQYNSDGAYNWSYQFTCPDTYLQCEKKTFQVYPDGTIQVAFICQNRDDYLAYLHLVQLSANGEPEWSFKSCLETLYSSDTYFGVSMAADVDGNTYAGISVADSGPKIMKVDTFGEMEWNIQENATHQYFTLCPLRVDSLGNVILFYGGQDKQGSPEYHLIKHDTTGIQLWETIYEFPDTDYQMRYNSLSMDLDGHDNIFVSGPYPSNNDEHDLVDGSVVMKFNSKGEFQWRTMTSEQQPIEIQTLSDSTATMLSKNPNYYNITKYLNDGYVDWSIDVKHYLVFLPGYYFHMDVTQDGYIALAGTELNKNHNDILVYRYNKDGEEVWTSRIRGQKDHGYDLYDMVVDDAGNTYLSANICYEEDNDTYDDDDDETGCGCSTDGGSTGTAQVILTLVMLAIGLGARRLAGRRNQP